MKRPPLIMRIMANTNTRQIANPTTGKIHQKPHVGPIHGPGPHIVGLLLYLLRGA